MFLQNTPILWDAVPRVGTLGWYALPRWGKWKDDVSESASVPPMGIAFYWAGMRCPVGAIGQTPEGSLLPDFPTRAWSLFCEIAKALALRPVGAQEARGAGPCGLRSVVGGSGLAFDEVGKSDGSDSQEDKGEDESCEHELLINPDRRISSKIVRGEKRRRAV